MVLSLYMYVQEILAKLVGDFNGNYQFINHCQMFPDMRHITYYNTHTRTGDSGLSF